MQNNMTSAHECFACSDSSSGTRTESRRHEFCTLPRCALHPIRKVCLSDTGGPNGYDRWVDHSLQFAVARQSESRRTIPFQERELVPAYRHSSSIGLNIEH